MSGSGSEVTEHSTTPTPAEPLEKAIPVAAIKQESHFDFLGLPSELRIWIYEICLVTGSIIGKPYWLRNRKFRRAQDRYQSGHYQWPSWQLLAVNRLVRSEAGKVLLSQSKLVLYEVDEIINTGLLHEWAPWEERAMPCFTLFEGGDYVLKVADGQTYKTACPIVKTGTASGCQDPSNGMFASMASMVQHDTEEVSIHLDLSSFLNRFRSGFYDNRGVEFARCEVVTEDPIVGSSLEDILEKESPSRNDTLVLARYCKWACKQLYGVRSAVVELAQRKDDKNLIGVSREEYLGLMSGAISCLYQRPPAPLLEVRVLGIPMSADREHVKNAVVRRASDAVNHHQ